MKYTQIILLSSALFIASCTGGSTTPSQPMALYPDSASMPQAEVLVARLTPALAAQSVIDWMKGADRAEGAFARRLSRDIMYCYLSSGDGDKAEAFSVALDSIKNTLTLEQQVHLFTVSATPAQLGRMIATDPQRESLAPLIQQAYSNDSTALAAFRDALSSELTASSHAESIN